MAYQLEGEWMGDVNDVLDAIKAFDYYWAPQGYWAVDGRKSAIEQRLRPLVGNAFDDRWVFSMIVKLEEGNFIPPHEDKPLAPGVTRRHLVLSANDKSWCMHGNEWQQLDVGGVYTMEPQYVHAAINWGVEPRIHLVVDSAND